MPLGNRLGLAIYEISQDLSKDLGPDVRKRAEAELDARLGAADLRALAVEWIVDAARDAARARTAQAERGSTWARQPEVVEHRESERRPTHEEVRSTAVGHVGRYGPGSASQYNDCTSCVECRETKAQEREIETRHLKRLREITDQYEAGLRAELFTEWTEQLLGSEIAMPDGTRTTWGKATVSQHRLRHDMLVKNVTANMENAVRHSQAIELIESSGAMNLEEALRSSGVAA